MMMMVVVFGSCMLLYCEICMKPCEMPRLRSHLRRFVAVYVLNLRHTYCIRAVHESSCIYYACTWAPILHSMMILILFSILLKLGWHEFSEGCAYSAWIPQAYVAGSSPRCIISMVQGNRLKWRCCSLHAVTTFDSTFDTAAGVRSAISYSLPFAQTSFFSAHAFT